MKLPATRSAAERVLDEAIELTFPASDPIAVHNAFRSARRRDAQSASRAQKPPQRERKFK